MFRPLNVAVAPEKEADAMDVSLASHSFGVVPVLSSNISTPLAATFAVFMPVTAMSVTVSMPVLVERVNVLTPASASDGQAYRHFLSSRPFCRQEVWPFRQQVS